MRVGIDLGSTYSGFARYDYANDRVEPITFREGDPFSIPSVVYITSKGAPLTGNTAKNKTSSKLGRRFEYFKMLLNEKDEAIVRSRGYDDKYTPREITKIFLEKHLEAALNVYNESRIENLCICVPEIWSTGLQTLDGRSILREILQATDVPIDHIQVVTEPEAASAYFAYNYEIETKKSFNGYLLLIDYGGGTLDITLTEIVSSGKGNMEICYREGCGAGENHVDSHGNKIVGDAGVAYIQNLVLHAIRNSGEFDDDISFTDPKFVSAVLDFESSIKSHEKMSEIESYFGTFGTYSDFEEVLNSSPEDFAEFEYCDSVITVTYQDLYRVYKETIEPVLLKQVNQINDKVRDLIKDDPCKPSSGNKDNFKIALVGGFSGCFFVKAQLYEIYNMDANLKNDPRIKNISTNKKEQAISLGAALLAADKVRLQKTSRYSIGLYASDANKKFRPFYGIKYHQSIIPGKPYFMLHDDSKPDEPSNRVVYSNLAGIKQFIIEFSGDLNSGGLMNLNSEMLDRLKDLPAIQFWNCGFSMDDSGVISFHILPRGEENTSLGRTIKLDSYSNMFDLTAVKEVKVNEIR